MKEFLKDYLHRVLITVLLCSCLLSVFMWLTGAAVHTAVVLLILFAWTALIAALDRIWRWPAALGLTVLTQLVTLWIADTAAVAEYLGAVLGGGGAEASVSGDVAVLMLLMAAALVFLYAMRGFWPRAVLCIGWIIFWVVAAIIELAVPKLALAAITPVILFTLVQALHLTRSRKEEGSFEELSSGLMSMFFAASLVLMLMPTSVKPYGYPLLNAIWDGMEKLYHSIETQILYRGKGDEQFGMSFNGYSEDGTMGSGLYNQDDGLLFAKPKSDTDGMLYLLGNTWDTYADDRWMSQLEPDADELLSWNMDTAEHIYALWRYSQTEDVNVEDLLRENNVYITYQDVRLRTLFTARNCLLITTDDERFPWQAQAGRTTFDYLQKNDTYYRLYYLEENPYYIARLIESSEGYEYGSPDSMLWWEVNKAFGQYFVLSLDGSTRIERQLLQREERIRSSYLALPDDISDEVRALAKQITSGCDTDYEKLMAIQSYLQTNYSYTTSPDAPPFGTSMLDYMLFESREGYCTWYATAAAVLARCVGVPARYAQGYCVSLEEGKFTPINGTYSHAWCEGYISGYGWITVEATPGYSAYGSGWGAAVKYEEGAGITGGMGGYDDYVEDYEDYYEDYQPELPPEPVPETDSSVLRIVIICAFALTFAGVMVVALRVEKRRREYENADYSQKAVIDLRNILVLLARRGYRRRPDESLRKYFTRLKWSTSIDIKQLEQMALLYEEVIFGEKQLTEERWQESRQFVDTVRRLRRK